MADWWTAYVQVILGTLWLASHGVISHGVPPKGSSQGTQHHSAHGGAQETLHHTSHDGAAQAEQDTHAGTLNVDDIASLHGVHHEFKIDIGTGQSECFFQWIKQGSQLRVSFEVLRGGDRKVNMYVKRPDGVIHDTHVWTSDGNTETVAQWEGDYEICVDNSKSRFSTKLVDLIIVTFMEHEMQNAVKESGALNVSVDYMVDKVRTLRSQMAKMLYLMGIRRKLNTKDMYWAQANNSIVQNMSIMLVLVFMASSAIQMYFVRHMFKTVKSTPTQKPRA